MRTFGNELCNPAAAFRARGRSPATKAILTSSYRLNSSRSESVSFRRSEFQVMKDANNSAMSTMALRIRTTWRRLRRKSESRCFRMMLLDCKCGGFRAFYCFICSPTFRSRTSPLPSFDRSRPSPCRDKDCRRLSRFAPNPFSPCRNGRRESPADPKRD